MRQEVLIRGIFSGIFGLIIAWIVFSRYDTEVGSESTDDGCQRYQSYIPGYLLPLFLLILLISGLFLQGAVKTAQFTLSICFELFVHISVYYLLLLLLLPVFRRLISARACAMLWVMPNYLYLTSQIYMELPEPAFVLITPGNLVWILFFVWLAGFLTVLFRKILEHLSFRRRILTDSVPVTDPELLAILEDVITDARIKNPKFRLVTSPHITSPLSIGLFRRTIRIILPEQDYSREDQTLILQHEIIHIAREDSWSKYFLMFCTAMCWFNPLMWTAMRKSAEDLELSCDETVLLDADDNTRRRYALLLLNTAADGRGFTTCLSASARSMRFRLKHITAPVRRRSGAIVVGLIFFLLCMTSGYAALAYGGRSGAEVIYHNEGYQEYALNSVSSVQGNSYDFNYKITNETAFHAYLSGLTFYDLTGNYSFSSSGTTFVYILDTPDGMLGITLYDNAMKLTPLYEENPATSCYYIADSTDWEYLNTITVPHPVGGGEF